MEVTCERCNTEYEFDDALVSDQGTSVRCTTCGHKFRVKRESGNAPEVWVVRTVDGRELEFRALRELKGAISTGRIGRDDVLSRGVGRPRRLASIAELEPFFIVPGGRLTSTAVGLGDAPRPRSRTPHGLGPPSSPERPERTENSVAFSLPKLAAEASVRDSTRPKRSEGATTSVLGTPAGVASASGPSSAVFSGPESFEPETTPRRRSRPPNDNATGGAAASVAAGAAAMHQEDEVTHAKARQGSDRPKRAAASVPGHDVGPPTPPPRPVVEEAPPSQREASPPDAQAAEEEQARTAVRTARAAVVEPRPPSDPAPPPPPAVAPALPASTESEPPPSVRPIRAHAGEVGDADVEPPTEPKPTPTPAEMRFSITSEDSTTSDPRFAALSSRSSGGSSAVRLFAGLVLFGLIGFGAILLVRYLTHTAKKADSTADERITALLAESDKLLLQGDVDAANEQLAKATELSDTDAKVARAQARLANVRAEVPCLRAELLADGDAERDTSVAQCAEAAEKAGKAVSRALSLSPDDAEAIRAQIDQKRLSGDVAGARKLVDRISSIQSQPDTALVLGALDLREASPPWQSVMDRLSKAAAEEGDLGRARSLLVYALARSGDLKRARSEFDKITRMTHAHPLKATLAKFLDRADKGELPAARVDDLPSASGTAAPIGSGKLGDNTSLLSQAHEAFARHDLSRAEKLYQMVRDRDPSSGEAVAGLAAVAREEGQLQRADALYKQSLDQNNGYIPAIVSAADVKWETGQKDAAVDLYSRLLELDPNGPDAARARARIAERNAEAASHADTSSGGATAPPTATPTVTPTATPEPTSAPTGLPSDVPMNP